MGRDRVAVHGAQKLLLGGIGVAEAKADRDGPARREIAGLVGSICCHA